MDAAGAGIAIACGSNVQDHSTLVARGRALTIGKDTTIGHNVRLRDCTIGDRVLVGIGSSLAAGTQVEDDVLVAAASRTSADQRLDSGWLWGGRPARPIARLSAAMRATILNAAAIYVEYDEGFAASQRDCRGV